MANVIICNCICSTGHLDHLNHYFSNDIYLLTYVGHFKQKLQLCNGSSDCSVIKLYLAPKIGRNNHFLQKSLNLVVSYFF